MGGAVLDRPTVNRAIMVVGEGVDFLILNFVCLHFKLAFIAKSISLFGSTTKLQPSAIHPDLLLR